MKAKLTIIAKGVNFSKICNTPREVRIFHRDMPARFGLLYSKKPYVIGTHYLNPEN